MRWLAKELTLQMRVGIKPTLDQRYIQADNEQKRRGRKNVLLDYKVAQGRN